MKPIHSGQAMLTNVNLPRPSGLKNGNRSGDPTKAPRCGARARSRGGQPCQAPAVRGKRRCRMHGGISTGPRTPEGLERSRGAVGSTGGTLRRRGSLQPMSAHNGPPKSNAPQWSATPNAERGRYSPGCFGESTAAEAADPMAATDPMARKCTAASKLGGLLEHAPAKQTPWKRLTPWKPLARTLPCSC
jgi:hypothetical protein